MKIAYVYTDNHLNPTRSLEGTEPKDYSYGAIDLIAMGHDVEFYAVNPWKPDEPKNLPWKLLGLMCRALKPQITIGHIYEAKRVLAAIGTAHYDAIVVIPCKMALAFSLLTSSSKRCVLIGVFTGIMNIHHSVLSRIIFRFLLRRIVVLLLGEGERDTIVKTFHVPLKSLRIVPFGVDCDFWSPGQSQLTPEKDYIIAVGSDANRDYAILLEVARKIETQFVLLTNLISPEVLPHNVKLIHTSYGIRTLTFPELRSMYQNATLIVTPIKNTYQPSGQSVTLQAMSCAKPVILADFDGLWCTDKMTHGHNVLLYAVSNPKSLEKAIVDLMRDHNLRMNIGLQARADIEEHFSSRIFAQKLERIIHEFQ